MPSGDFASVVIPSPLTQPLTYRVGSELKSRLSPGARVLIPLGRRTVTGVVFDLLDETSVANTKEVASVLDERPILDAGLIRLSRWVAQYYMASLGEVLAALLPPGLRRESRRSAVAKPGVFNTDDPLEKKLLARLQQKKSAVDMKTLAREFPGRRFYPALERLQTLGAIELRERLPGHRRRAADDAAAPQAQRPFSLNAEQQRAFTAIDERLGKGGFETFLLHGVTGSGKTEIYLRAMERVSAAGRQSLILIPEISLTPQLIDRVSARFPGRVGVLHSGLTAAERWAQWWRISAGEVDVVVGARSAVFAPLPNLGLIVVDEEHDSSYKQEDGLRYNGRDLAVVRGKLSGCAVVLGSGTPAIESYQNALEGRYRLLEITQRVYQRPLPRIETVDLRTAEREGAKARADAQASTEHEHDASQDAAARWISRRLAEALRENYRKSRQSLIFLNRRGFANFLQCTSCGYVLRCQHCSVTLTLHLRQKSLCCHHCNFRRPVTDLCPSCGNSTLAGVGAGTEQIEALLRDLVPGARIARMDRDTTGRRGSHARIIRLWENGEIDVLIGTQMITKGHDVGGVTVVGALLADLSLNLPDFRSAERTFQLLTQVAGRSGRGDDPGTVLIQTYDPDHYVIQHLINHDYKGLVRAELDLRRALDYPPFSRLVAIRLDGPSDEEVERKAKEVASVLRQAAGRKADVEILGPAPAPLHKLRNRYRWQLLLKSRQIASLFELARRAGEARPRSRGVRLHVDVDPYSML